MCGLGVCSVSGCAGELPQHYLPSQLVEIKELLDSSSVFMCLSHRPFREKMNNLLRAMLKLDPAERMTFNEFYTAVDDIITSKIEIVNLLHGTSMKVIMDSELT